MSPAAVQTSFEELGSPLREVVFTVVDLETTGGAPQAADITEVGAVRVCGGEVLGEFQSLVRPRMPVPPFIAVLTGITDSLVAGAPGIGAVLPTFLEFARGSVLVAHNAPFDVGFLRAAAAGLAVPWPDLPVLDTARLARRALTRDEAPDCRLSSLARLFHSTCEPCHRALADARATVFVLHGLLERLGNLGVQTLEELVSFTSQVPDAVRRKRHLAATLPHAPGVYLFRGPKGEVLYVGKSADLRSRVRSYFTAAEGRRRVLEMVRIAERVDHVPCAHSLEAEVRELRLIAEHAPRYNRRSRFPERALFLRLTNEPFPRLSVVRGRRPGALHLGPYRSSRLARAAEAALLDAVPLRQCRGRLPVVATGSRTACALGEMGRCGAPCDGSEDQVAYDVHVRTATTAIASDPGLVLGAARRRLDRLCALQRFEEAAVVRDRLAAFVQGAARLQRLASLESVPELVAARPAAAGRWEVAVVRHGRLAGSGVTSPGVPVRSSIAAIVATAETVAAAGSGHLPEETELILRWLGIPGVRLVELAGCWCSPAFGAESAARFGDPLASMPREATS